MFSNKSGFNVYLDKVKDKNVKKHYIKEFHEGNVNVVLESTESYRNYFNFLIESKQLDVSKLSLEEEILLIKHPKIFYEAVWDRIKDAAKGVIDKVKDNKTVKAISTGMKTVGSAASRAVQAVKNFDITKLPASIKSGFMETWKNIKKIAGDMWKKAIEIISPKIRPLIAKIKEIMQKPHVRILLACASLAFNIIAKNMTPVGIVMSIIKLKWLKEWPELIGKEVKTIAEAAAEIKKTKSEIDDAIKKSNAEYDEKAAKIQADLDQAKKDKAKQEITKESFNESFVYNDYYAEAREFLNSSVKVYNEGEVFVYNELTGADLPMKGHPSVKNAIKRKHNFVLIKDRKVDGKKFDIIIDLKNNRVGCLTPNNGMVDLKATIRFISMFNDEDFDLDDEKMYKWGKGEWSIIKKAIERGTFDSSSMRAPSAPSINNKKGNLIVNNGSGSGRSGGRSGGGSGRGRGGMGSGSDVTSQNTANAENKAQGGKVGDINIKIDNAGASGGSGLTKAEVQAMLDAKVTSPEPPKGRAGIAWLWSPEALRIYSAILLILLILMLVYYLFNMIHGAAALGGDVGAIVADEVVKAKGATIVNAGKKAVEATISGSGNATQIINKTVNIIIQSGGGDVSLSDVANDKVGDFLMNSMQENLNVIEDPIILNKILQVDLVTPAIDVATEMT